MARLIFAHIGEELGAAGMEWNGMEYLSWKDELGYYGEVLAQLANGFSHLCEQNRLLCQGTLLSFGKALTGCSRHRKVLRNKLCPYYNFYFAYFEGENKVL